VPVGFVSDGESIPRLLAPLAGPPCRREGTLHDWLMQSHRLPFETANLVYREALLARPIDPVYADQRYAAVEAYGRAAWEQGPARLRILTWKETTDERDPDR